jgi:23S rRNA (cytidine1920-2'-O)/16S rRNA (cytidine1409-2'-O)-methyltransferase
MKQRLDVLAVAAGLAQSREQAQRLILAGLVRVGGHAATKAGHLYPADTVLELVEGERFVGRGGEKLEGAFAAFALDVVGRDCLDVGASTGGFTDCLLQHGAARVVALDVGHGQIHPKLSNDPRVTVMEGFNARHLAAADLPYVPQVAVTDVSFISLTLILPPMAAVLAPGGLLVALIKPQFEAGREQVGRGGVVRDPAVHEAVVARIADFARGTLGLEPRGVVPSPLRGPKGNIEFLACWRKPG